MAHDGKPRRGRGEADELLAAEIAAGKTVRQAAAGAGVSERTAHRRLADPNFKTRVVELRGRMVSDAAGQLAAGMTAAANTLLLLLGSQDEHVRHKTAVKVIDLGVKVIELAELQKRVEELERRLTEGGTP